jgi:[ribosomal protein S5]-alanine N-acetyltransferase
MNAPESRTEGAALPSGRAENMPGAQISTSALAGRLPVPQDITDLTALLNNPLMVRWLGAAPSLDAIGSGIAKTRRHWLRHGWGGWVFKDAATGEFVGRGGLAEADIEGRREVELAYAIRPDRWGEGLGTAVGQVAVNHARRHLDADSLVAFTVPDNAGSLRVMAKLGFVFESEIEHAGLPQVLYRLALR